MRGLSAFEHASHSAHREARAREDGFTSHDLRVSDEFLLPAVEALGPALSRSRHDGSRSAVRKTSLTCTVSISFETANRVNQPTADAGAILDGEVHLH